MQAKLSLNIAAFSFLLIVIITCWIAVLLRADTYELLAENILGYIIEHYAYTGLKGLLVIGIIAMLMSTADSYINSASILLAHDFCVPMNIEGAKHNELLLTKLSALILGLFALFLALITNNLLEIIVIMASFYMPLVTVPLFLAIFGFRTSNKSYIFGIFVGAIITISSKFTDFGLTGPIITVISIILVAVSILVFHYITKQRGGWIKSKAFRNINNDNWFPGNIFNTIRKVDFLRWLEINRPKNEISYTIIGLFFLSVVFSTMYNVTEAVAAKHSLLLSIIYYSVLAISAAFLLYPVWPQRFKNRKFDTLFWLMGLFYVLVLVGYLQVIISNFGQFQLIILLLSAIVLSSVVRWQIATAFTVLGVIMSTEIFQWYIKINSTEAEGELENIQFKIVYLLLMITNIFIIFLKPKQEHLEVTEAKVGSLESEVTELNHEVSGYRDQVNNLNEKVTHYSERVEDQAKEIERLGATAQKILNNVNHELRLPVGNVMNFAQILGSGIGKMSSEEVKMISEEVYTNTTRLSTMILNMLDLAMLSTKKIELKKKTINFSELVEERVKTCRAVYLQGKKIDFRLTIKPELLIAVDSNYIRQVVDNIVINSINFSEEGLIEVIVEREDEFVKLTITDEGKGIAMAELYDIFTPFKMGSNSESKAQGRGVGLALCKAAIEAHGGTIKAENNSMQGARFIVLLPFYKI